MRLPELPTAGEAASVPWAGSYWPTYEDNINFAWDASSAESPARKYELAFGGEGLEDKVSAAHGIDSAVRSKVCAETSECNGALGEVCAKRRGAQSGRCIATWWGICHAWAPASILLPEPKHPVTRNGVTFKVQDLKALGSLVFNRTRNRFVSLRCNRNNRDGGITYDPYGRPTSGECRDTNPGTYHILLANYLGRLRQSFVEDRTFDYQVWNQPMRSFEVVEQREVTAQEANKLVGATTVGGEEHVRAGTVAKDAWSHQGSFAVEPGEQVKVKMTGTGDADLYVRFGAEPSEASYDCRPFAAGSSETCDLVAPEGATALFVSTRGEASDESSYELRVVIGGAPPETYVFNDRAQRWMYMRTHARYISEASSHTDGNLSGVIDRYTRTDRYEYILELDAAGAIIGGEWVGPSHQNHPDFVWLPLGPADATVAQGSIAYETVKSLFDESVVEPGDGQAQAVEERGSVARGELVVFGPYDVADAAPIVARLSGTGDADLYVRKGSPPTLVTYDCAPLLGDSTERCELSGPAAVYVGVHGNAELSEFVLNVDYRSP